MNGRDALFAVCAAVASATVILSGYTAAVLAPQVSPRPAFTADQARLGKTAYAESCASCHMPDLSGKDEAPPLAGRQFRSTWRTRTTKDLFDYLSTAMPPGGASLTADTYLAITAHILQVNGGVTGQETLRASTAEPIGSVITAAQEE